MKERLVKKYSCDFCHKTAYQRAAMERHERACTMNPDRHCKMCDYIDNGDQKPIKELVAILPFEPNTPSGWNNYQKMVDESLPKLRELSGNCPTCILAALRQAKIPVPIVQGFDYEKECQDLLHEFNPHTEGY